MTGSDLQRHFSEAGHPAFAIAFFSCMNNVSNLAGSYRFILETLRLSDCKIQNGTWKRKEIKDYFVLRSHFVDGRPQLSGFFPSGFVLEGKYTAVSVPVRAGQGGNESDDLARLEIDRISAMVELILGVSSCTERHHLQFFSAAGGGASSYSNIATAGVGETLEIKVTIAIGKFLSDRPKSNVGIEKIHAICDLIARTRGSSDRNTSFMAYWIALESAVGGGKGRAKFANLLGSVYLDEKLKSMKEERDAFFHEGKSVIFSEYDEQIVRASICCSIFCNENNISSARDIFNVIKVEEEARRARA